MRTWVYNPHVGGVKIPPVVRLRTEQRVRAYAEAHYGGKFNRLDIRFRGVLCYIDAYIEPRQTVPLHLCRCDILATKRRGPWRFTLMVAKSTSPACSATARFTGPQRKHLKLARIYLNG